MKKLAIPFMFVAILVGLFEQSKTKPNIYILCITLVIFMFGMIQLMSKGFNKKEEIKEEKDVE